MFFSVSLITQIHQEGYYSPNEVSDNEELHNAVDDADGPAFHHHRFSGFIGEEICYTRPHPVYPVLAIWDMDLRNMKQIPAV